MAPSPRFHLVGPLNSGLGSRAQLGIRLDGDNMVPVVLLPVPRKTLDDPEALLHLRKETDRAVALEHPSILRVFGLVPTKKGLARATAYANGEPFRRVLTRAGRLPPALAGRIVADVATGVHFAHLAGSEEGVPLVHGDLRPETLMVSYSGHAMVTGYGALTVAPTEVGGKRIPGRRKYAAPEQILGGRAAATPQSDVFLLALILWESLTGNVPFQDAANPDKAIISDDLALDSARIPEKLRPVLQRALTKKGTDRHPTAMAFRDEVESALGPFPSDAEVTEWLETRFIGDPVTQSQRDLVARALQEARGLLTEGEPAPAAQPIQPPPLPKKKPQAQAPAPAAPAPRRAEPAPAAPRAPVEAPAPVAGLGMLIAVGLVAAAVGAAGGWFARGQADRPKPVPIADLALPPQAPPTIEVKTAPPPPEPESVEFATAETVVARKPAEPAADPAAPKPEARPAETVRVPDPTMPNLVLPTVKAPDLAIKPIVARVDPAAKPEPKAEPKPEPKPAPAKADPKAAPTPTPAAEPGATTLELFSVPSVDVALGGKKLGQTPLSTPLPPGKHTLTLTNAGQGIRVTREVEVKPTGATHVDVRVGVGNVGFHAPAGARVYIDKKGVGVAPIERRVQVYEGTHTVAVEQGTERWEETFQVADGDRITFTARPDLRPRNEGAPPLRFTKEVSKDTRLDIP